MEGRQKVEDDAGIQPQGNQAGQNVTWIRLLVAVCTSFAIGFLSHGTLSKRLYSQALTTAARIDDATRTLPSVSFTEEEPSGPSVVVGIMTSGSGVFWRIDCILNTWMLNDVPASLGSIETIFFTQDDDFYPAELDLPLTINLPYPGYPPNEKNKAMWEWFVENRPNADFYMKLDSDTYLFKTQLLMWLRSLGNDTDMDSFISGCCGSGLSGAAYIASRSLAQNLVADHDKWWECETGIVEDVAFRRCVWSMLHKSPISNPQFMHQFPNKQEFREERWLKFIDEFGESWPITIHHINTRCYDHAYETSLKLMRNEIHNHPNYKETRQRLNVTYNDILEAYGCPNNESFAAYNRSYNCTDRRSDYKKY